MSVPLIEALRAFIAEQIAATTQAQSAEIARLSASVSELAAAVERIDRRDFGR